MDKRVRALAAMAAVAGGVLVGPVLPGARAQAAPVTLAGCGPTSGSSDTGALRVTVDDAAFAGGAMVALHDRTGAVTYPAPTDSAMASPVCGVQRLADGSYRYEWLYCTDPVLNTCATEPLVRRGLDATGVASLTDLDKARLAWLIDTTVDNATAATRVAGQRLVWCVTEGVAANAPAPGYFNDGSDPALSCPNWPAIDPVLSVTPTLTVTGPSGTLAVGATARFEVATDVSPVDLASTGLDALALCPGTAGATLAGGRLTITVPDPAAPVAVCATGTAAGTATLRATIAARTSRTLEFWQRATNTQFCQGMLSTETLSSVDGQASATAVFAVLATTTTTAAPEPTTTTTVPGIPVSVQQTTTTTDGTQIGGGTTSTSPTISGGGISPGGTLPRTGAEGQGTAIGWALVLLGAGVVLVTLGRRPARR